MMMDINERILDRLDQESSKIDDLCDRMARLETTVTNHLEHQAVKFTRTTVVIGIMIGIVGVVTALK